MDATNPITDAGLDPIVGGELFKTLGISVAAAATDPVTFGKLREIAEYLHSHPQPIETIRQVSRTNRNPKLSHLDHFAAFVKLERERIGLTERMAELEKQLKHYR